MGALTPPSRKSCYNFRVTEITKVLDGDTIDVTIDLGFDLFKKDFHSALEGNTQNIHEENKNKNNLVFMSSFLQKMKK